MGRPLEALVWENRRLFRELAQAADKALAPLGVTAAERALLEFLARERGPVSLSEIARRHAVSRQHVHQTLARLSNPRWVARSPDTSDARSVALSLSREGRAFWGKVKAIDLKLARRLERRLDANDLRAAVRTLQAVRRALQQTAGDS